MIMSFLLTQLLERDPEKRLGCKEETEPIRSHPFFRPIDWQQLEARKLHSPYKPIVVCILYTLTSCLALLTSAL